MHHYQGQLTLRRTSEGGRASPLMPGVRPHVRIGSELLDVTFTLLAQDQLRPGESAAIGVSFLSPHLVESQVRVGDAYRVFEGPREIGTLEIQRDVWSDAARLVQMGEEYDATVMEVGWTSAKVLLENGWTAALHSRDIGLAPWAEIGDVLRTGHQVRVRVEAIDVIRRIVTLSLQQRRSAV